MLNDIYAVGALKKNIEAPQLVIEALGLLNDRVTNIRFFDRLIKSRILYISDLYSRCQKTNSSYAKFKYDNQDRLGLINCFVKTSNCQCESFCEEDCGAQYYAVIRVCDYLPVFNIPEANVDRIYECVMTDVVILVDVRDFICVCFYMTIEYDNDHFMYLAEPLNFIEID